MHFKDIILNSRRVEIYIYLMQLRFQEAVWVVDISRQIWQDLQTFGYIEAGFADDPKRWNTTLLCCKLTPRGNQFLNRINRMNWKCLLKSSCDNDIRNYLVKTIYSALNDQFDEAPNSRFLEEIGIRKNEVITERGRKLINLLAVELIRSRRWTGIDFLFQILVDHIDFPNWGIILSQLDPEIANRFSQLLKKRACHSIIFS